MICRDYMLEFYEWNQFSKTLIIRQHRIYEMQTINNLYSPQLAVDIDNREQKTEIHKYT